MKNLIKLLKTTRNRIARGEEQLERWKAREAELTAELAAAKAEMEKMLEEVD